MIRPLDPYDTGLVERVRSMFIPGGLLSKARNYEYRQEQEDMATAVADALQRNRHLIIEAGTGVGKSLGYLLPSLMFAHENGRKALVSTYTINLQEQLFNKDIPVLEKLLPFEFKSVLLKGRQNYICPRRLMRARQGAGDLFVTSEVAELDRLAEWLRRTRDGTLSDLDPQPDANVWSHVCSEPHACTSRTCGNDPLCFYQQARKRILDANLVIMNHNLLFTYMGGIDEESATEQGYLFPNDFLIIDEAHNIENIASRHIGLSFSSGSLRYLLNRLYQPRTRKGLLPLLKSAEGEKMVVNLLDQAELFFAQLEHRIDFGRAGEVRVTRPDVIEDSLSLPMMQLRSLLLDLAADQENEENQQELRDAGRRLADQRNQLKGFLAQEKEDYVYWVERSGRERSQFVLQAAPVDLASYLRMLLFREDHSSILASATLSVAKGLEYYQKRIGGEESETLQVDSPFDYQSQMKVYIPRRMPDPKDPEYESGLQHWIRHFVSQTEGKAFVLFTSYSTLQRAANSMRSWFEEKGWTLLAQGSGTPRHQLLARFKEDLHSVLFGTDSFWQGVDVPGESLSNVIITRLPFAVPDHPLIQAKLESIEARGGDPFKEYSLPEAILKFRQGVGRLIRTKTDSGQVAILDPRVLSKAYGRAFLAKLPECPVFIVEDEYPGRDRQNMPKKTDDPF